MSHTKKTTLLCVLISLIFITFSFTVQTAHAGSSTPGSFVLLSKYSASADIGDEFYIIAITSNGKQPTWKSSSSGIASVSTYGKVTAKKAGTVTLTAKIKNAEASCEVTVKKTQITINMTSTSIEHGEKLKLTATTSNLSKVTWKSSKPSIAAIDELGNVAGVKPGETTITASADGSSTSCRIRVQSPVVMLDKSSVETYRGRHFRLSATVSSGIAPIWKTNKKSVAVVDEYGNVTSIGNGTATITATVDGVSKSCKVSVKKPDITLNVLEINLKKGTDFTITANVSSGNPPVWSSSNPSIATVDGTGKITAHEKGTAYIYASEDGTKAKCKTHVIE